MKVAQPTAQMFKTVTPLMTLFLVNILCGLGGTQRINLPMFTVLRRFSILFTLLLERKMLGVISSPAVNLAVALMIGGAFIAALFDLTFDLQGYLMILGNDLFTALYGVTLKTSLSGGQIKKNDLLFYNSLLSAAILPVIMFAFSSHELEQVWEFEGWADPAFRAGFCLAALMGSILNYSIFYCTQVNSALTTTVVGCLKNVLTNYLGMLMGDYVFSFLNFLGLHVSIAGSLVYSWATFKG
ncbi:unnamed protein product [Chrysoparadoxa australica]